MTKQILKPVLIGILMGVAVYILPFFFFRGLLFFLVIGLIFRFFFWGRRGRWSWHRGGGINPAFADTLRNMSTEEYDAFKRKFDRDRMSDAETKNGNVKP